MPATNRTTRYHRFQLSDTMDLLVYREETCGFAPMRLVDSDGDFLPVTMHELLTAISAVYYCQKKIKNNE